MQRGYTAALRKEKPKASQVWAENVFYPPHASMSIILYLQQSPSMKNIEKTLNNQTGSSAIQSPMKMGSLGGLGGGLPLSLLAICATDADWAYTLCKAVHCENSNNEHLKVSRLSGPGVEVDKLLPWVGLCEAPFASLHQIEQH